MTSENNDKKKRRKEMKAHTNTKMMLVTFLFKENEKIFIPTGHNILVYMAHRCQLTVV